MLATFVSKGVEPVRWLVLIGIAYTLASIIWTFFTTPITPPSELTGTTNTNDRTDPRPAGNVNWILSKNLFGEAGAAPEQDQVNDNEPAVPTKLQLELQAVFVADVPEDSAAIIAQRGKPGQHYKVGRNVPGNAKLISVEHDRVYLRRAGIRETLAFPKAKFSVVEGDDAQPDTNAQRTQPRGSRRETVTQTLDHNAQRSDRPPPQARPQEEQRSAEELVDEYANRLNDDAQGTLNELGLETAEGGGYRLGSNARSTYLQRTGLQPGDTIMSVNGRPVGDIQQDRLELENVLAQGSARIEVLRGQRRFFVTVSLQE